MFANACLYRTLPVRMKYKLFTIITLLSLLSLKLGAQQNPQNMKKHSAVFEQIFPQGEKLPEQFSKYFTGQAYLAPLSESKSLNVPVSNVTFEPGCRNNWHSHTGGQLLLCTAGRGYYQEQGQPARELLPGDVVEIAPNVVHWHGAAPDSWFSHLAVECNPDTNSNLWLDPVDDEQYAAATSVRSATNHKTSESWFPNYSTALRTTDPDLAEIFDNFAFGETQQYGNMDLRTRIMVTMASCIAQKALKEYEMLLGAAIAHGISPLEIKEILYHAVPYAGMSQVAESVDTANRFLIANGYELPLESQAEVTPQTRFEKGLALQKTIFGNQIDDLYKSTPDNQIHIQRYLSANCFGDYQTRTTLDPQLRELLTFAMLVSMGGCEPQVKAHIAANVNLGNDKNTLLTVLTQLLPYIGYPRTLNGIACVNAVIPE